MTRTAKDVWTVQPSRSWPPTGRRKPPFGPTEVEVIRSCPLRSCFEASGAHYPRRQPWAAKIGTAFHRTLESLMRRAPADLSPQAVAQEAADRFDVELQAQADIANSRPRERSLPKEESRASAARLAIAAEAHRLADQGWLGSAREDLVGPPPPDTPAEELDTIPPDLPAPPRPFPIGSAETEAPVKSTDGLFKGRIDRAEHLPTGTRLIDVKSALRRDLPERYERQLQLYALMWADTRDDWPAEAAVLYPFTGAEHAIPVDERTCRAVAADSAKVVDRLSAGLSPFELGTPGDVCKVCEFRPWCRPFWSWQRTETDEMTALTRAGIGFEGALESVQTIGERIVTAVRWRSKIIRLTLPADRFPHVAQAAAGARVRVLDTVMGGMPHRPHSAATDLTEVFLVAPDSDAVP